MSLVLDMSQNPSRQTRSSQRQQSIELSSQSSMDTNGSQPSASQFENAQGTNDVDYRPDRIQKLKLAPGNIGSVSEPITPTEASKDSPLTPAGPGKSAPINSLPTGNKKGKPVDPTDLTKKSETDQPGTAGETNSTTADDKAVKKKKKKELKEVSTDNKTIAWNHN